MTRFYFQNRWIKNVHLGFLFVTILSLVGWPLFAQLTDIRETLIENLSDRTQSPRLLNAIDVEAFFESVDRPAIMASPQADFDRNGTDDYAVSGIYNLPRTKQKYFLLVGSIDKKTKRPKKMFFKEYCEPVFLFEPGSTGEGDPGHQSFSISHCIGCSDGTDFFWNSESHSFVEKQWSTRVVQDQRFVAMPEIELSTSSIDQALKIVGELPDVISFVKACQNEKATLLTRVFGTESASSGRVVVLIAKKVGKTEVLYDELSVDLIRNKVIARRKEIDTLK